MEPVMKRVKGGERRGTKGSPQSTYRDIGHHHDKSETREESITILHLTLEGARKVSADSS